MRVITMNNEKGGVGKTTLAINLAAGLARLGYTVALIDADPQGTATRAVGLANRPHFHDWIIRDAPFAEVLLPVVPRFISGEDEVTGSLFCISGDHETRNISENTRDMFVMLRRMEPMAEQFDFVIVDTSPTPSLLHSVIFMASDAVIYPTQLETWSFEGLSQSLQAQNDMSLMRQAKGLQPIETLGIVPTMTQLGTLEHAENIKYLTEQPHLQQLIWRPIPRRIIWTEAAARLMSIFAYAPVSQASEDAINLVRQVLAKYGVKHE